MKLIAPLLCLFILIALPAQARDKVLDIKEVTSPGGIKAWLVEDHSVPVISLQFSFKGAGAANEPADKQGLSRMASNTMDEGAGELDSQTFQKELRDKVISLHFSSGRDDFGGSVKTLTVNSARAFELLQLALTKPRFDAEPVERMRHANMDRVRSSLTDPDWMAARIQNDVVFAGHPYAQNSGGSLTTLAGVTVEDLRGFVKNLSKDRLHVAAAGDISEAQLTALLDKVFGALPATSELPAIADAELKNAGSVFVYKYDIPQTVIEMSQGGIDRKDPDYQAAQVMNFVLGSSGFGSRLTKEIREDRGLTYGIYSYFAGMDHADTLAVSTSTKNENVAQVIALTKAEWKKMIDAPVSEEELKNAKTYLIGSLPLSLTSTDDISGMLLSLQLDGLPINYLEEREEKIKAATAADVSRVAKRILNPESLTSVLVGQPQGVENAKIIDKLPNAE